MTRVKIAVGIKGDKPVEISPGEYKTKETIYPNINANVLDTHFGVEDSASINQNVDYSTRLSFLMANDRFNRLSKIRFIEYLGVRYKATNITIQRPRVEVTLGEEWQE